MVWNSIEAKKKELFQANEPIRCIYFYSELLWVNIGIHLIKFF